MRKPLLLPLLLALLCQGAAAQTKKRAVDPFTAQIISHTKGVWPAMWCYVPGTSADGYGVYDFRRQLSIAAVPPTCKLKVSADNRYKLYVNGRQVALGPARSDIQHYNYDTIDIAPYLQAGRNAICARVWNEGPRRACSIISLRTAFILCGDSIEGQSVSTPEGWQCRQNRAYSPIMPSAWAGVWTDTGVGEKTDLARSDDGWLLPAYKAGGEWSEPAGIFFGCQADMRGYSFADKWMLQPSPLPQQELAREQPFVVRRHIVNGRETLRRERQFEPMTIAPRTRVELLLDQRHLTNAYLNIACRGGRGAKAGITYQEALYSDFSSRSKGNRNDIEGKTMRGRIDSLLFAGGAEPRRFTPLYWRTWRYVQIDIETDDEPLQLDSIYGVFTGYPMRQEATLTTTDDTLRQIWQTSWRTQRLCATETFNDCSYYEQLQYLGDTRIQALVTMLSTHDDRLVRNFLDQCVMSATPEGVMLSRYPAKERQMINTYSISFIGALYDFLMYRGDIPYVKGKLHAMRGILDYFGRHRLPDGRLCNSPGWNFTDWAGNADFGYRDVWFRGAAVAGSDGCSAVLDLQYLMGLQMAAKLEQACGLPALAQQYSQQAEQLKESIRSKYWDNSRGLFSDRSDRKVFSQHSNALALLTQAVPDGKRLAVAKAVESDTSLIQATIYFDFYVFRALAQAGLADHYLDWLGIWRDNLRMGMTTWSETSDIDHTRSDCHAWGCSPNIELLRTVLGIDSREPGFKSVSIEPHLGRLKAIGGSMPHPAGTISVSYQLKGNTLNATVTLPDGVDGTFSWQGQTSALHAGLNHITARRRQ